MDKAKTFIKDCIDSSFHTVLPEPLARLRFKRLAIAAISVLVSIATAIAMRNIAGLMLIIISVYFAGSALKLSYDYVKGKIAGYSLLCLSVTPKNNCLSVVFEDDDLATYVFIYNSKRKDFLEDVKYNFYTHASAPKVILAYEQI